MKSNRKAEIKKFILVCIILGVIYGIIRSDDIIRDYAIVIVIAIIFALCEALYILYKHKKR